LGSSDGLEASLGSGEDMNESAVEREDGSKGTLVRWPGRHLSNTQSHLGGILSIFGRPSHPMPRGRNHLKIGYICVEILRIEAEPQIFVTFQIAHSHTQTKEDKIKGV
jgi:hypothetical protein